MRRSQEIVPVEKEAKDELKQRRNSAESRPSQTISTTMDIVFPRFNVGAKSERSAAKGEQGSKDKRRKRSGENSQAAISLNRLVPVHAS